MNRTLRRTAALAAPALLLALLMIPAPSPALRAQASGVGPGQTAPDFQLAPVGGGKAFNLSQFKGKPVVLVFWATWCPPCRREIPALKDLYQTYTAKGVQVVTVTINFRQNEQDVIQFRQKYELPYIILWDKENKVSEDWGVDGIPTNFVLDRKGVVRFRSNGLDEDLVQALEGTLKNP